MSSRGGNMSDGCSRHRDPGGSGDLVVGVPFVFLTFVTSCNDLQLLYGILASMHSRMVPSWTII